METLLRREGFHQYVIFQISHSNMDDFVLNMLARYQGEGLLPIELQCRDGGIQIDYEISGGASLSQAFLEKEMDKELIKALFESLWQCCGELREYLLPVEGLLLRPEQVYYFPGKKQFHFCYLPENSESFSQAVLTLVEFCMQKIKQGDSESLLFVHGFYRLIREEASEEEIKNYLTAFFSSPEAVLPCHTKEELEEKEEPVKPHENSTFLWWVCGGLAVLCLMLSVIFAVRFFAVTHSDRDMKICVILGAVMLIFLYSMKSSRPKRMIGKVSLNIPDKQEDSIIREVNEDSQPMIELEYLPETDIEDLGETRVLNGPAEKSGSWVLEGLRTDIPDIWLLRLPGIIGRKSSEVDYPLPDKGVSRRHLLIFLSGEELYAEDLSSTNGTFLNGERLKAETPVRLSQEDRIAIGHLEYRVSHR